MCEMREQERERRDEREETREEERAYLERAGGMRQRCRWRAMAMAEVLCYSLCDASGSAAHLHHMPPPQQNVLPSPVGLLAAQCKPQVD